MNSAALQNLPQDNDNNERNGAKLPFYICTNNQVYSTICALFCINVSVSVRRPPRCSPNLAFWMEDIEKEASEKAWDAFSVVAKPGRVLRNLFVDFKALGAGSRRLGLSHVEGQLPGAW